MGKMSRSPWLLHYDASSCNGCDIEVLDCLTPKYDIERFGIINTGDPFQADILLITGGVNSQTEPVVKQLYSQMPSAKVVVAVGICACTGGVFKECYNIRGGIDTVIPVDVYVPGCAARPESIIDGVAAVIFASTFGVGVVFSAIPLTIYQGGIAALSGVLAPFLTDALINEMSAVGSLLIIGLSFNMLGVTRERLRVGNMLPAMLVPCAYFPIAEWLGRLF